MNNRDIVQRFDDRPCEGLEIALARIQDLEGGLLLSLAGSVDNASWRCFRERITRALDNGFIRLVFDLSGLRFIGGGSGLGSFTHILRDAQQRGGNVALVNLQPNILEQFQLLGFSPFFNVRDTLDEAVAFLSGTPASRPAATDRLVPGFDDLPCEGLAIDIRRIDGVERCVAVALDGSIGLFNAAAFHRRIMALIGAGFVRLILDLGKLASWAAPAAGTLPSALQLVRARGGDVVLAAVRPPVRAVLEAAGFLRTVTIRKSADEAVAFLAGVEEPRTDNDLLVPGFDAWPCPHLSVSLRKLDDLDGGLLVGLSGFLARDNAEAFLRRLELAVESGYPRLVLDLQEYCYTTAAGLEALAGARAAARRRGGGVVLVGLPPVEEQVFAILGRARQFAIRGNLADAAAYFASGAAEAAAGNDAIVPGFDDDGDDRLAIGLARIDGVEGGLLLSVDGRLDHYNCDRFVRRVMRAVDAGFGRLVFDLGGYRYLNGRGVGSFGDIANAVRPKGGEIALFGVRPEELDILRRLELTSLLNVRSTLDEAVAAVTATPAPATAAPAAAPATAAPAR